MKKIFQQINPLKNNSSQRQRCANIGSKKVTGSIIEVQRTGAIPQQHAHPGRNPGLFQPGGNALGYR